MGIQLQEAVICLTLVNLTGLNKNSEASVIQDLMNKYIDLDPRSYKDICRKYPHVNLCKAAVED